MRRVIVSELLHRRGRTVALLIGILVATTSFTVLTGGAASQHLEVKGTVAKSFRTAYDVLVRPHGSRTGLERRTGRVRPNYLSGQFGGITVQQWRRIRALPGVQVAAPIANVGFVLPTVTVPIDLSRPDPGHGRLLLRVRVHWRTDRGLSRIPDASDYVYVTNRRLAKEPGGQPGVTESQRSVYARSSPHERVAGRDVPICPGDAVLDTANGPFDPVGRAVVDCFSRRNGLRGAGWRPFRRARIGLELRWPFPFLLAAVDPRAEARLNGLDRAVVGGRYLSQDDRAMRQRMDYGGRLTVVPVLAASHSVLDEQPELTVERLSARAASTFPRRQRLPRAQLRYLDGLASGRVVARRLVDEQSGYAALLATLRAPARAAKGPIVTQYWTTGPTSYRARRGGLVPGVQRPRSDIFEGDVYQAPEVSGYAQVPVSARDRWFRGLKGHVGDASIGTSGNQSFKLPQLTSVGTFDPNRLPGVQAADGRASQTYEPPALAAADARSRRLLHGRSLAPNGNLRGYLAQPPLLLTTLRAVGTFGPRAYDSGATAPISAVRVRVAGVTGIDAVSRERIRATAERIARRTGLDVDLTVGSSPAPTTVDLAAGRFGRPPLALTEPWTKKNVATQILTAVDRKSLLLFVLILIVCALFVTNATGAAVRARRVELGVLSCLGWSTGRLFAVILGEVALIGLTAGILGGALALPLAAAVGIDASLSRAALAVPAAVVLSLLAALVPASRAARSSPIAAVRPPVLDARRTRRPHTIAGLALTNLIRVPGRSALGALSLAIGVCALTLLLAAAIAFRQQLVGTLLGSAVSVQVRTTDYVAVVATIVLGAGAVADVLFLNVRERAGEFATLGAIGWNDACLARLVTLEGIWIGAIGSGVGALLGLAGAAAFAGGLPSILALTTLAAAAVGTAVAGLAALAPALLLSRAPVVELLAAE